MIKLCEHPGCKKPGTCRAPKDRNLKEYWHFCQEHAAEYNKNWNYYDGMSKDEIDADWEEQVFGSSHNERAHGKMTSDDYVKFINAFLNGRDEFDKTSHSRHNTTPSPVTAALRTFELPITATWRDISARYRILAKKYHPDTASNKKTASEQFMHISNAYDILKKHFGKK